MTYTHRAEAIRAWTAANDRAAWEYSVCPATAGRTPYAPCIRCHGPKVRGVVGICTACRKLGPDTTPATPWAEPGRPAAKCGTESGYKRHYRTLKEPACDECREAHVLSQRLRAARRKDADHRNPQPTAPKETTR